MKKIINIDGNYYRIRCVDQGRIWSEDKGLYRAEMVKQDWNGWWFVCDDDDYMIDKNYKIIARETGWRLERSEYE